MAESWLETDRLILRQQGAADLAWQLAQLNTPQVMRHLGGVRDEAAVSASFAQNGAAMAQGQIGFWTAVLKETGEPVGKCGLAPIAEPAAPQELQGGVQIGWSLAEPYWRRGLASEAARAVIGYGFGQLQLLAIWSQTSDSNRASSRLMARLGLQRRPEHDYTDPAYPPEDNPTTIYRIDRAAWGGQ